MNRLTSKIRDSLGLGEKADPGVTHLPPDYYDQVEVPVEASVQAQEQPEEPQPKSEEDLMAEAAHKLEALELPVGAWSLIDRAVDSLSRNTGAGLEDPDAVERAKQLAGLAKIADGRLDIIVQAIIESTPVVDRPGAVYSTLYRVLQNCVFFANLDYQQAQKLDVYSEDAVVEEWFTRYVSSSYVEEALARVVEDRVLGVDDAREKDEDDKRHSDMGFEDRRDAQLRALSEVYGSEELEDAVLQALNDVRLYFQLTCESLGWDVLRPMPFGNTRNPDGTFTPIEDAQTAIDAAEIKRQASLVRRREARRAQMSKAQEAAAAIIARSMQRPTIHTKK